ncbi:helix-turn-helix transcriptional regulator [Xenorhabdus bovienii]|uniref:helix-turn-helix transcriptional regulator n=1 Tax=Xenorhabdus bovienii TaxID=40576 RepID=UPI00056E4BAD|nr:helix-turn-helix transcriptional regulator [Xenorhabdus bovienii]MDE9552613.1 helix-turn-helix transcriptional regulator [Xenorhabdus bovienii]MDE9566307.1 helix-turn-helix transcriptional regulator [Xenorhabdus bovienii]
MSNDLLRWKKQSSQKDWQRLAQLAGTSVGYLNQIAYGNRRASPAIAERIEKASGNQFFHITPVKKELLVFAQVKTNAA